MAILQQQRGGFHSSPVEETSPPHPKATSVSGIYLLGNEMNLSEVLGVEAAPGLHESGGKERLGGVKAELRQPEEETFEAPPGRDRKNESEASSVVHYSGARCPQASPLLLAAQSPTNVLKMLYLQ